MTDSYISFISPHILAFESVPKQHLMHWSYLFWLTVVALSTPAVAQGVLNSVDSQDGSGESESLSTTHSVSSKGMIILCTIVAVVVLIGGMSLRVDAFKR